MILFQCKCGAVHRVDAQYAGGTMQCPCCGAQIPIPLESDPNCVLIYKAGESEDGIPMHLDTVRLQLVSGELSDTELIWDNSTWRPLGEYMGMNQGAALETVMPGDAEKPRLTLKRDTAPQDDNEEEIEIAESLEDLTPIQQVRKVAKVEKANPEKNTAGKKRFRLAFWKKKQVEAAKDDAASGEEQPKKKRGGKIYYTIQVVLGILAITVGYKLGFGPLISKARNMPSFVIVQNHEPYEYIAQLGWRRLKQDIYKNGMCSFEIYVGMSEKQTLRVNPKEPGQGEAYKVKVPVRPGGTIIVNLKQLGDYGLFDPSSVGGKKLAAGDVDKLEKEFAAFAAPQTVVKLNRDIRDLVRPAFKGTKNDLFFVDTQYDLQNIPVFDRTPNKKEGEKKEEKPVVKKDMVVFPPVRRLNYGNGYAVYDHTDPERVERGVYLNVKNIVLSKTRTIPGGRILLELRGDKNVLNLSARIQSSVTDSGAKFTGEWRYSAAMSNSGDAKGRWKYQWQFVGNGDLNKKTQRLTLTVQPGGNETKKIQEVR